MEPPRLLLTAFACLVLSAPADAASTLEKQMPRFSKAIVNRDYEKAAELAKGAAKKGYAEAQYRLAVLLRNGRGIPSSERLARKWLTRAAKNGHRAATKMLKRWPKRPPALALQPGRPASNESILGQRNGLYSMDVTRLAYGNITLAEIAAWRGDSLALSRLAASGLDLLQSGMPGRGAIMMAATAGHAQIVRQLLSLNQSTGNTREIVDWVLLEASAKGHSPVIDAIFQTAPDLASDKGAIIGAAQRLAATGCHADALATLLAADASNRPAGENEAIALVAAARNCNADIVELLLKSGAAVDHVDSAGSSALWRAAAHGDAEATRLLLAAGSEVDKADSAGVSPLHIATMKGHTEVVRELLKSGADHQITTASGHHALSLAANGGHAEVLSALLDNGAKPDARTLEDRTALMYAALRGHSEVVLTLKASGADTALKDTNHRTAAELAALAGHKQLAAMLSGTEQ